MNGRRPKGAGGHSVFDLLKKLLAGGADAEMAVSDSERGPSPEELRLAACVLFLELAWADEEFSQEEQVHLHGVIKRHFGLEDEEADALLTTAEAERSKAVDLWRFTTLIREHYSIGQKMVLAEAMWGLVYSDGVLSSHEGYLIRKLSNLLNIKIGYLSEAKRRWEVENLNGGID
jgi:uncharacterized tellurite resistance protein B-like protein